jgi:tetratricopeptide (TPR) repeat protein
VYDAVTILRDRTGSGGTDPGMGNPLAVNQLIAHHAVVFSPSDLLVWVSTTPYQLGKFVAYDLKKVFSDSILKDSLNKEIVESGLTIAADTFLFSREYSNYEKYLKMTGELISYTRKRFIIPDSFEDSYIETNPMLYLTYYNLGNYFYERGSYKRAYDYYQIALSKNVAGETERNKILRLAQKARKKQRNVHS